jgi:hypothetical protein
MGAYAATCGAHVVPGEKLKMMGEDVLLPRVVV